MLLQTGEEQEPPRWSGDAQRRKLTGFSWLRAVLWARSVQIAELSALGSKSWYWKLRFKLWWAFRRIELHAPGRLHSTSDVYGSTPLLTLQKLLQLAEAVYPEHERTFLDLGCGMGQLVMGAACLGYDATGLEQETEWAETAGRAAAELQLSCRFQVGDLFEGGWSESGVIFVVATAFSVSQRERLIELFRKQPPGTLYIVGDMSLEADFLTLWSGKLPVDWGIITFGIYVRVGLEPRQSDAPVRQ